MRNAKESPKRADAFKQLAKTFGVAVKDIFWTEGWYDVVTIVEAPDESSAMSLSLSLGALGNVLTESLRAFSAADMTTIVGKMVALEQRRSTFLEQETLRIVSRAQRSRLSPQPSGRGRARVSKLRRPRKGIEVLKNELG
ncbi:GYD domain-containing protein [Afipia massiliensis]|uniref:GYD domain-containing protein n=1 Tax=Afipia massiliensis TaxID=211460 RepID=A0A4U6BML6_9BRAD|nr:GYD domain-containing protein [Afipia massiliensis]